MYYWPWLYLGSKINFKLIKKATVQNQSLTNIPTQILQTKTYVHHKLNKSHFTVAVLINMLNMFNKELYHIVQSTNFEIQWQTNLFVEGISTSRPLIGRETKQLATEKVK